MVSQLQVFKPYVKKRRGNATVSYIISERNPENSVCTVICLGLTQPALKESKILWLYPSDRCNYKYAHNED
jgi:hypothetical protein